MRAREFIVEGYKEVETKFVSAGADPAQVQQYMNQFRDLVNRNQVKGNERNIDWWGKNYTYDDFVRFLQQKSLDTSKSQIKKSRDVGRSITLQETDDWLIVVPLDKDASCFHGKNSDWCTTKRHQGHFEDYFYNRNVILIYCLNKKNGGMWAIANHRHVNFPDPEDENAEETEYDLEALEQNSWAEYFDQKDNPLTQAQFDQLTGLNSEQLLDLSDRQMHMDQPIDRRLRGRHQLVKLINSRLQKPLTGRDLATEQAIIDAGDDKSAFEYARQLHQTNIDAGTLPTKIQQLAARRTTRETVLPWFKNPDQLIIDLSIKNQSESLGYALDHDMVTPKMISGLSTGRFDSTIIQKLIDKNMFTNELRNQLATSVFGIYALHRAGLDVSQEEIENALITREQYSEGIIFWDIITAMQELDFVPSDKFFEEGAVAFNMSKSTFRNGVIEKINEKIRENADSARRARERVESSQKTIKSYQDKINDHQAELKELEAEETLSYRQQDRVKTIRAEISIYNKTINDYADTFEKQKVVFANSTRRLDQLQGFKKQLTNNL